MHPFKRIYHIFEVNLLNHLFNWSVTGHPDGFKRKIALWCKRKALNRIRKLKYN